MTETPPMLSAWQLSKLYPEAFGKIRPLRVGIFNDLFEAHQGQVKRKTLHVLLHIHTSKPAYLAAIIAGGPRYALDGTVSGEVTEQDQQSAKERLEQAKQKRKDKTLDYQLRAGILKKFEASGLSKAEFAKQHGITEPKLSFDLKQGAQERLQRREKRLRIVERLEQSGVTPEVFAAQSGIPLAAVTTAVRKVAEYRASTATPLAQNA